MSTERELVEKFKEAFETRNIDKFSPYLTEDMTYEILPPSFVIILVGGTSWILSALMQGREESVQS